MGLDRAGIDGDLVGPIAEEEVEFTDVAEERPVESPAGDRGEDPLRVRSRQPEAGEAVPRRRARSLARWRRGVGERPDLASGRLVMDDKAVGLIGGIAAVDAQIPPDPTEAPHGIDGEREGVGRHGDRRRRDDPRLGVDLPAIFHRHSRHRELERDVRIEEPPAAPAERPADGADGVVDQAVEAPRILDFEVAPIGLVEVVPLVDVGPNDVRDVVDDDLAVDVGLVPEPSIAPERDVAPEGDRRGRERVELDDRRILDRKRRRLVGEGSGLEEERGGIAAEMDDVVAGSAGDADLQPGRGAEHVGDVVAAGPVDDQPLDPGVGHDAAGPRHEPGGDDERVGDRRAVDDDRVDAGAAEDVDRGVLQILVAVVAGPAEEPGEVGDRGRVAGVVREDEERVDDERVVVLLAEQEKLRRVVIDLEAIVAGPAVDVGRV